MKLSIHLYCLLNKQLYNDHIRRRNPKKHSLKTSKKKERNTKSFRFDHPKSIYSKTSAFGNISQSSQAGAGAEVKYYMALKL